MTVNSALGSKYGIHLLLLYPEFMASVGMMSHFILGLSLGGFIMSFHISSYILNGFRFPFIATLSRPFYKFSLNNSIIPLIFILNYFWALYFYQKDIELVPVAEILKNEVALLAGIGMFTFLTFSYFLSTNWNLGSMSRRSKRKKEQHDSQSGTRQIFGRSLNWYRLIRFQEEGFRTKTYLSHPFKVELARSSEHYEVKTLMRVLAQNRLNATFFELAVLITIFVLGIFVERALYLFLLVRVSF